jgi:hypothetical protein
VKPLRLLFLGVLAALFAVVACENEVGRTRDAAGDPVCQPRDAEIDFGEVVVGETSIEQTVVFRNTGSGTLGGAVSLEPGPFEIVSGGGAYSLAPGQLRRVGVRFRPGVPGPHEALLRLGSLCRGVDLVGRAMPGDSCIVEPDTLDFGRLLVGGAAVEKSFTLRNPGATTLRGFISAPCGASFTVVGGGGLYELAPGQSRIVTVRFNPTGAGDDLCLIETELAACADVVCIGAADNPPMCQAFPTAVDFGPTCVGSGAERTVQLRNTGSSAFSGLVAATGGFTIVQGGGAYTLDPGATRNVTVRFAPQAPGDADGELSFGLEACAPVSLSGRGAEPVVCLVSTTQLDFGTVFLQQAAEATFSLTNNGCATASGTIPESCGGDFTVVAGGGAYELGPGQTRFVTVRFTPAAEGLRTCTLQLGAAECGTLSLRGTGARSPLCQLSTQQLDFGSVVPPNGTSTRNFTITNAGGGLLTGTVPASCGPFTVTAGAGAFSLGEGQSRMVTVRFQPTEAGAASCVLEFGETVCTGLTLTGVGESEPLCQIVPTTLQFGSVVIGTPSEKSFTVTNAGGGMLTGTISENCAEFQIVEGGGTYALTAGQSRTVVVRFTPAFAGQRTCGIGLGSARCNNVQATGSGIQGGDCRLIPTSLDFGTVLLGDSLDRNVTISNFGGTTISGNVSAACPEFSIVAGGGPFTLTAGASRVVTVRFRPTTAGEKSCTIATGTLDCAEVPATATAEPPPVCAIDPPMLDFGLVTVNATKDLTVTITNAGGGTLSGTLSENCGDYSIVAGAGSYNLSAGQSRVVTVRFRPLSVGAKPCTLNTGTACAGVPMSGTGDAPPACVLEPTSLAFGAVTLNTPSEKSFTMTNAGGGTISGTVSSPCPDFTIVAGGGAYNLGAGQSRQVTVRFLPTQAGNRACTIETGSGFCSDVPATGFGDPPPACAVSATQLPFGTVGIGGSADQVFTITNSGGGLLTGTVSLASCADFTLVSGAGAYSLPAGQAHTVTVRFQPQSTGAKQCVVETGSALCSDVTVSGTGENLPVCTVSTTSLNFGFVTAGSSSDQGFTITNTGGGTLTGSVTENCAAYSVIAGAGAFALGPGQVRNVTIRFAPTTFGAQNCAIDLGTGCPTDVNASGTGAAGFAAHVRPIILASGCTQAGCHNGVNQVDLSIYANAAARTDANNPPNSALLIKPGPPDGNHGGGENFPSFDTGTPDYNTILTWIQQGVRP